MNFDASAIALVVAVASPVFNTFLNNLHNLKMREMDIKEKENDAKNHAIDNFLSISGAAISMPKPEVLKDFGKAHFLIYQYVPSDLWQKLDFFYQCVMTSKTDIAHQELPEITRRLAQIKNELPQQNHK